MIDQPTPYDSMLGTYQETKTFQFCIEILSGFFLRWFFCYSQRELLLPKIFITKNTQIILKNNLYSYRAFLSQLLRPTIFLKKQLQISFPSQVTS